MIGIYFSGTGNTKHAVKRFVGEIDSAAECFSIEEENIVEKLSRHEHIVFGFPIYYSNVPKIVKDFIEDNKNIFVGKKIFIIATKGLFNACGIVYSVKRFKKYGAIVTGSLQLKMPDNIRDLLIMQIAFDYNKDSATISKADKKILKTAKLYKEGKKLKSGLSIFNHIIGLFLRILPFYPKTNKYKKAPKINCEKCTGCGICVKSCPKNNLTIENGKAVNSDKCTLCYRCFGRCPNKAITLLGKKVYRQYYLEE